MKKGAGGSNKGKRLWNGFGNGKRDAGAIAVTKRLCRTRPFGPPRGDPCPGQCPRIWLRNSLVRSDRGLWKKSCGLFCSTIWP